MTRREAAAIVKANPIYCCWSYGGRRKILTGGAEGKKYSSATYDKALRIVLGLERQNPTRHRVRRGSAKQR